MPGFEWAEPDVEPAPNNWLTRTVPPYPDPDAEGTAAMWARLREERNDQPTEEDEAEFDIVITETAHEFDDPISPLAGYLKLAHSHGWEILTLSRSRAFAKGKPFKSGANEGTSRPDQNIENQWCHLRLGRDIVEVYYTLVNGEPRGNDTMRRLNRERIGDRDLKNYIKGVRP